jgi:RHH-type proline utilization regulon transcriptional repressor/proline dehydrogenase/delta 1-pyrroline-5-carboxylate dehydrogenase
VIEAVIADPSLADWKGFGLAIQAYQKRAGAVIDAIAAMAERHDRQLMVRLVKGAYWDTEVKRAQERGLDDYPVFTRKAMTDLNYVACAEKMLAQRPRIYPQFATHNALTVASIIERAGGTEGYEFQRLHGMGEALYGRLMEDHPGLACRAYAPVGGHRDLLAYLVRRLLENGANSSFVSVAADPDVPVEALLKRPADIIVSADRARHPAPPLPRDLYGPDRANSRGVEFGHRAALDALLAEVARAAGAPVVATALIDGRAEGGTERVVTSPIDGRAVAGRVVELPPEGAGRAIEAAQAGFRAWAATPVEKRAAALARASDLLEERRGRFLHLLQVEGGKTLDDAVSELREAVDFCRYYAAEGRRLFGEGERMPGPTGESNVLRLARPGVFVAISPGTSRSRSSSARWRRR